MKHFNHPQQAPWRRLALCVAALGLTLSAFADNVSYISRSWDATNKVVKDSTVTVTDAIPVTSSTTTLGSGGGYHNLCR